MLIFSPAGDNDTLANTQVEMHSDAMILDEPHQVAAPVETSAGRMDIERFSTHGVPASIRNREHFIPGSPPTAQKKPRPTSEAQRDIDDRQAATAQDRSDSNMGSLSMIAIAKKPRVEVDADMGDLRLLSAILRGAYVTEVYSPKRVVEVCYTYQLVEGDLFDLRTGFDLSDPRV